MYILSVEFAFLSNSSRMYKSTKRVYSPLVKETDYTVRIYAILFGDIIIPYYTALVKVSCEYFRARERESNVLQHGFSKGAKNGEGFCAWGGRFRPCLQVLGSILTV